MRAKFFLLLFVVSLISSCGSDKIQEGEVVYELSYPYMDTDGFLGVVLPKEMTIIFKGTKMRTTIKRGKIFETNIISDEADRSLEMFLFVDDKRLHCKLTDAEISDLMKTLPSYTVKNNTEQDSVSGVFCSSYNVKSSDSIQPNVAWFTEDFAMENAAWFSSYADVKGFPMIYDIERYGIFTHAEAIDFTEKEIADSLFTVEGEYKLVDFKTYESEAQAVFDILIDW